MMRNKLNHDILILLIMMMLVVHFQSIHVVTEDKLINSNRPLVI